MGFGTTPHGALLVMRAKRKQDGMVIDLTKYLVTPHQYYNELPSYTWIIQAFFLADFMHTANVQRGEYVNDETSRKLLLQIQKEDLEAQLRLDFAPEQRPIVSRATFNCDMLRQFTLQIEAAVVPELMGLNTPLILEEDRRP